MSRLPSQLVFQLRRVVPLAAVALAAACTSEPKAGVTDPPPPPVETIAAHYALTQVNGAPLPAEVYAGVYLDETTGFFRDVRVVATEGFIVLRADSTFEQRVKMQAYVDGVLSGRPNYEDFGRWSPLPSGALVQFTSDYNVSVPLFHGVAQQGRVRLSQELTGGEAGATPREYTYARQ